MSTQDPIVKLGVNLGHIQYDHVYTGYQNVAQKDGTIGVIYPYKYVHITGPAKVTIFTEIDFVPYQQHTFEVQEGEVQEHLSTDYGVDWIGSLKIEPLDTPEPGPEATVVIQLFEDFPGHKVGNYVGKYQNIALEADNEFNLMKLTGPARVEIFSNPDFTGDSIHFNNETTEVQEFKLATDYNFRGKTKSIKITPPGDDGNSELNPEEVDPADVREVILIGDDQSRYAELREYDISNMEFTHGRITGPVNVTIKSNVYHNQIHLNIPLDTTHEFNLENINWTGNTDKLILEEFTDELYELPPITGTGTGTGTGTDDKEMKDLNLPMGNYFAILAIMTGYIMFA